MPQDSGKSGRTAQEASFPVDDTHKTYNSGYSDDYKLAAKNIIVDLLSDGVTLRAICRMNNAPSWTTVYDWMDEDADFALRIARARVLGFDAIAEDSVDIADDGKKDFVTVIKRGVESVVFDKEHVQRSKLRVWTRLQLLAKWSPEKYGDMIKHANPDGKTPIGAQKVDLTGLTDDELVQLHGIAAKLRGDSPRDWETGSPGRPAPATRARWRIQALRSGWSCLPGRA